MVTAKAPATAPNIMVIKLSSSTVKPAARTAGVVFSTPSGGNFTVNKPQACRGGSPLSQTLTNRGYMSSGRSLSGAEIDTSPSEFI